MSFLLRALLISLFVQVHSKFEPTKAEVGRAVVLSTPRPSWAQQARKEGSLRVLIAGGSNVRNRLFIDPIADYLRNISAHPDWTGSMISVGRGGCDSDEFIGTKFEFESLHPSQWPNVILFELSANIQPADYENAAENIDATFAALRFKYSLVHQPEPDFGFVELFSVTQLVNYMNSHPHATLEQKLRLLHSPTDKTKLTDSGLYRGCPACVSVHRVADFYDLPIISWRLLAYQAFIRYFLATNTSFTHTPWPFTREGLHIDWAGSRLLFQRLFRPFLSTVMASREELSEEERFPLPRGVRMFPPKVIPLEILTIGSFDQKYVSELVRKPTQWRTVPQQGDDHYYCSNRPEAPLHIDLVMPVECSVLNCSLTLGFLHGWNTSRIGNLSCALHSPSHQVLRTFPIIGNQDASGVPLKVTRIVRNDVSTALGAGNHTVSCKKTDDRLTCLRFLGASSRVEV